MFVPKKWLFSLLLQPYQGWLLKLKNWLMSKICQPLSIVSGFFRSHWFGLLHCHIMDTDRSSQLLSLISAFWIMGCLCVGFSKLPTRTKVIHNMSKLLWPFRFMVWGQAYASQVLHKFYLWLFRISDHGQRCALVSSSFWLFRVNDYGEIYQGS